MEPYRRRRKVIYELTKHFEFNKTKLLYCKLQRFCRRRLFYNLEAKDIPGIYRFHCYVYDIGVHTTTEIESLRSMLSDEFTDKELLSNLEQMMELEYDRLTESIKDHIVKVPIVLDLREYMPVPKRFIVYKGENYRFDEQTKNRLRRQIEKVKSDSHSFDMFMQIINYSKAMQKI